MSGIKRRPSYSKLLAAIAAVLALGASAYYAASKINRKQLVTPHIAARQPAEQANTPAQRPAVARHAKPSSVYWGAEIGPQLTGDTAPYDMGAVRKFQQLTGKGLSLVSWTAPFSVCTGASCSPYLFPDTAMEDVRQYGAIPLLAWGSEGL